jgi:hypothetical protein
VNREQRAYSQSVSRPATITIDVIGLALHATVVIHTNTRDMHCVISYFGTSFMAIDVPDPISCHASSVMWTSASHSFSAKQINTVSAPLDPCSSRCTSTSSHRWQTVPDRGSAACECWHTCHLHGDGVLGQPAAPPRLPDALQRQASHLGPHLARPARQPEPPRALHDPAAKQLLGGGGGWERSCGQQVVLVAERRVHSCNGQPMLAVMPPIPCRICCIFGFAAAGGAGGATTGGLVTLWQGCLAGAMRGQRLHVS